MDELTVINSCAKCDFCGIKKNNHLTYGPIYKLENIKAHYFCVLLSNKLIQNGNDDEGILGFLISDILKELQRTSNITCIYCNKGKATIQCASSKCKKSFHLPCGLENGSLHQFTDQFKSFCHLHRPVQNIPNKILKEASETRIICCICYDKVNVNDRKNNLWAPCCLKTWYHRYCVQKLAHSTGYFFRCAACNNVQKFNKWMQKFGVFVPQQDASWELVPHAFEELLFRYNKCDAEKCKCPKGRNKSIENTMWEIVLCESCGSQGIHVACGNLKFVDPAWECPACQKVTNSMITTTKISDSTESLLKQSHYTESLHTHGITTKADACSSKMLKLTEISQKKRRRDSEDLENSVLDKRKKCRMKEEEVKKEVENEVDVEIIDEEKEEDDSLAAFQKVDCLGEFIDVEAEDVKPRPKADLQEVLSHLKPGPLSYKLRLIQTSENSSMSKKPNAKIDAKSTQPMLEVIELSDSEEENEAKYDNDDDIIVIKNIRKQTLSIDDRIKKLGGNELKSSNTKKIVGNPEEQTVSFVNLNLLPINTKLFICRTRPLPEENPLYVVDKNALPVEEVPCNYPNQNGFSSSGNPVEQYPEKKVSSLDLQFSKTNFKDKEESLLKDCFEEVIVLSD